jgi:hypothetical protein
MLTVLVTHKELGGTEAFGPYRSMKKAMQIENLLRNPQGRIYRDPEKYSTRIAALEKYE